MKFVKYHIASLSIILTLLTTNIIVVLTAPREPLYELPPGCQEGLRCTKWNQACVEQCYESQPPICEWACMDCLILIWTTPALTINAVYEIYEAGTLIAIGAVIARDAFIHTVLHIPCDHCDECTEELMSCITDCCEGEWTPIVICPYS